jgi:hypothetical protein
MSITSNLGQQILARTFAAPHLTRRDKEELLLGELIETRKTWRRRNSFVFAPCFPRTRQAARICDILGNGKLAVNVGWLACLVQHRTAVIIYELDAIELVHEALRKICESDLTIRIPPVPVLTVIIPEPAIRVEAMCNLVASDDANGAVGDVARRALEIDWFLR